MKLSGYFWYVPCFVLIVMLTSATLVFGQDQGNVSEEIEELDFDDFEIVDKAAEEWTLGKLTGRMHPAVVHIPIAWMMLLLLVDSLTLIFRQDWLNRSGMWLLMLTGFGFIPAVLTGFVNFTSRESPTQLALNHRNMALLALGICIAAMTLRLLKRNKLTGTIRWIYFILILIATAVIGLTGHLGGKLVFGENYLPF